MDCIFIENAHLEYNLFVIVCVCISARRTSERRGGWILHRDRLANWQGIGWH